MPSESSPSPSILPAADSPTAIPLAIAASATGENHGPAPLWLDWLTRLALWLVVVVGFLRQLSEQLEVNEYLLPLLLFAVLMAIYLLASVAPVAVRLHRWAQAQPLAAALLPLLLVVPYLLYGRLDSSFDVSDLLMAAVLLFMPAALILMDSMRLRAADVSLGMITVALPLVLPLTRSVEMDGTGALLRIGAFLLPVLLLLFSTREQKQRLSFLFVCAVLSLWYSVEFNAFPGLELPGQNGLMSYFHLAAIPVLLYLLAASGRFGALGLSFTPSPRGVSILSSNLALFALIAVPVGLITHFITPGYAGLPPLEIATRAISLYVFIALPEEILFRGTLLRYVDQTLRWPEALTIGVTSLLFGAAHLNNPPNVGWYFLLATLAGVFYARTYLATKNVATAATLHAAVDWLWMLIFAG